MHNIKIRFSSGHPDGRPVPHYMGEATIQTLEIDFGSPRLHVAVPPSRFTMMGDPFKETREEYGDRLHGAAREAARHVERGIVNELRRMGHYL